MTTQETLELPQLKESRLTFKQGVLTLVFDRDDVRNALTGTLLLEDLLRTIEWVNQHPQVSVLILTGEGRAFSSGGNIKDMKAQEGMFADGGSMALQDRYRYGIQAMSKAVASIDVVTIAAINGPAIGAGFDLTCMCDLRIGCPATLVGETFINLGIIPGDGGAWFLQRVVGYQRALEMTMTGRLVKAEEAKDLGILLDIVPQTELLSRAQSLGEEIASKPPAALRLTKRLLKMAQRTELGDFLDVCASYQAFCHGTQDHKEAIDAFFEKREGKFLGR